MKLLKRLSLDAQQLLSFSCRAVTHYIIHRIAILSRALDVMNLPAPSCSFNESLVNRYGVNMDANSRETACNQLSLYAQENADILHSSVAFQKLRNATLTYGNTCNLLLYFLAFGRVKVARAYVKFHIIRTTVNFYVSISIFTLNAAMVKKSHCTCKCE